MTEHKTFRVFAFGTGPGPKNVGLEFEDGTRTVVTYRTFKYRYGGTLSEKQYAGASGIIQFDPKPRDVNGKQVTDVVIRTAGSQKLVSITIWPEFKLTAEPKKGDFIAADGSFSTYTYQAQDGSQRENLQLNPTHLVHLPCVEKEDTRQVVQSGAAGGSGTPF